MTVYMPYCLDIQMQIKSIANLLKMYSLGNAISITILVIISHKVFALSKLFQFNLQRFSNDIES